VVDQAVDVGEGVNVQALKSKGPHQTKNKKDGSRRVGQKLRDPNRRRQKNELIIRM